MIQGINASYLAAKSVNPEVQFRIVWANTWFDPALEADAAKTLIEQGADILMQHTGLDRRHDHRRGGGDHGLRPVVGHEANSGRPRS